MREFEDPPLDPSTETVRIAEPRRDSSPAAVLTVVGILIAVALGGWWLFRRPSPPPPPATTVPPAEAPATTAPESAPRPAEPAFELPSLAASDVVVRELASRISSNPELLAWFANDDLIRRFVATVTNLAEGASPAPHVRFLTPGKAFSARGGDATSTVDPASYRRYDLATEAFASLDTAGTARLYRQLSPLFDEAYHELGYPGRSFDEATARAIERLLAVELPSRPPELVAQGGEGWAYADPRLEGLSAAEKHLLRLGPENGRRAQAKLRELAAALELAPGG